MDSRRPTASPVSPGEIVAGKYRVDRVLGAGGMGVVVAASHVELDQPVALKFVLPEALNGKDAVERFMREARAVARLKSEHVARVFDVGWDKERPFMVLELLEGADLAKVTKQSSPLPVADAVEYVLQTCEALVEAHGAGIVHRDLKPQNLFVTHRRSGAPLVKVLDFGISKAIGPAAVGQMALTDSQAVIGSPLYMAPEQMRSARLADVRTDIWALGVILYELLGAKLPFDGETVTEVCIRVVNEPPPALLDLRPGLDRALVGAVMRCLEKEPAARWQNVAQLAAALEPFARSAQSGAPVRSWRSLEDTMDSKCVVPPSPPSADDTGPSTAVKVATGDERAAVSAPKGLVSTDVTWGQATADPPRPEAPAKPRSFAKGLAAGLVVSAAAAAIFVTISFSKTSGPTTSAAPAVASSPAVAPPLSTERLPLAAPSPSLSFAAATPESLPLAPPIAKAHPIPRASVARSAEPRATAPTATPEHAPNGAPILH